MATDVIHNRAVEVVLFCFWEADADLSDPILLDGNLDQYQQSKKAKTEKQENIYSSRINKLVRDWEGE